MMKQLNFPCLSEVPVPYLKRCEYNKKITDVVVDEVEVDNGAVRLLDPENVGESKLVNKVGKKVNVTSLLSSPKSGRDYLVNSGGEQVKVNSFVGKYYILIYCFELPVESDSREGLICWALKRAIPHWPNFQLVVVTTRKMDCRNNKNTKITEGEREGEGEAFFKTFLSSFPNCLAIPISDSHSYKRVSRFVGSGHSMVLDPNGVVVSDDPQYLIMNYGAAAFPFTRGDDDPYYTILRKWQKKRPVHLENLLGLGLSDILYNSAGNTVTVSDLKHKLVGLYLYQNGHRMDPIERAYQHCQANNLDLDIVVVYLPLSDDPDHFVTCTNAALALRDSSSSSFWWLLPFNDSTSRRLWRLCDCSKLDELIIVGPQGEFLETFAANIVTSSDTRSLLTDMYPYSAEAIARQETHRLNNLTLSSLFPKKKCRLLTQKGRLMSLKRLRGKIVCVFIANREAEETLKTIRSWCHENENDGPPKCIGNVVLVLVPFHSRKLDFNPNSSPNKLSWLWDSKLPWLICPSDPAVEASIIKHTTLRGCCYPTLSTLTFGQDGKFLSTARPSLSDIQANCFPKYDLYEHVHDHYTDKCERDHYDLY